MFDPNFEPTIAEIMKEPAVRALMKADRVNAGDFEARLRFVSKDAARRPGPGFARIDRARFPVKAPSALAERCCC